jgi:hypothetical protein
MQQVMGYLKNELSAEDKPKAKRSKQELLGLIEDYRQGTVPLIAPMTLLKHHLRRHPVPPWVWQQAYLSPQPKELMLRVPCVDSMTFLVCRGERVSKFGIGGRTTCIGSSSVSCSKGERSIGQRCCLLSQLLR